MQYNSYLTEEQEYALLGAQKRAETLKQSGVDVINLTVGDPKESTFEPLKDLLITQIQNITHSQYPKAAGDPEYLAAVSQWAKTTYGQEIDPETEILSCNGSKEAIFTIPIALKWTNKKVFIPSLSYPVYAMSAGLLDIDIEYLPLSRETGFLPDLDAVPDEKWKECGIFWINSPHNPTTAIASHEYFEKLLGLAEKHDFLVCSDECYNALYYKERPASCMQFPDSKQWLVFRSLSKRSHMTGFRVGAMISKNRELMSYLRKMRASMGVGTPTFIQKAAITAWTDVVHPKENAENYKRKRDMILPVLKEKGFDVFGAEAGFYLWFRHPNIETSDALCDLFASQGIVITPGTAFGDDGEGYARMVYCDTEAIIEETVRRVRKLEC
jgi:LL-diaminopimelate aminotransferase